jgi:hypothetical protein
MIVPFAGSVVDWATIGKVIAAALVAGVVVCAAFSLLILGTTRSMELRRDRRGAEATAYAVLGFLGGAVSAALIVGGIIVMSTK